MSTPRPGEMALNTAPTPYTARPTVKHRFRPYLSVNLPPGIINAAITSRKIVIATCTPCTVVSKSVLMSLIITFMFEPAKLQMNWARASGTSTLRNALDGRPAAPPSATCTLLAVGSRPHLCPRAHSPEVPYCLLAAGASRWPHRGRWHAQSPGCDGRLHEVSGHHPQGMNYGVHHPVGELHPLLGERLRSGRAWSIGGASLGSAWHQGLTLPDLLNPASLT